MPTGIYNHKPHSEEHKKKMSERMKGKNNPFYGKHHLEETKRKISEKHKGKVSYIMTEEIKKKISLSKMGNKNPMYGIHRFGKDSPNYGNPSWNKGLKGVQVAWNKGVPATDKEKERLKKMRKNQVFPVKDTTIEVKIQNFLEQLGIDYFKHKYMNIKHGYQCDILIPSINLVIECDGDYWHKYPIGNDIDHIRTKELIENGFKVLRLWEFEIRKMNIKGFKDKLKHL